MSTAEECANATRAGLDLYTFVDSETGKLLEKVVKRRTFAIRTKPNELSKILRTDKMIPFQWIPSHVNIAGNEIADSLARAGAGEPTTPAAPLTYLELFSKYKPKNKAIWMIPQVHPWYQSKCPGGSLIRGSSRRDQTALSRFLSGHLRSLTFVNGVKHF
ncbi:RNase H domain-containing protein [Trichonephila clavipes]|nr:RNase H domain-containing protein [Trichonephila clavipes]